MSIYTRNIGGDGGQTLVEFALILLLILTILFGVTEFGRAWYYTNALTNSARVGARYASTLENTGSYEADVIAVTMANFTSSIKGPQNLSVAVNRWNGSTWDNAFSNLSSGLPVRVRVEVDFNILSGEIIESFTGTKRLGREAVMRYE